MNDSLAEWIGETREKLERFLRMPEVEALARRAFQWGFAAAEVPVMLHATVASRSVPDRWAAFVEDAGESQAWVGRWILAQQALRSLDRIHDLPVVIEVAKQILRRWQLIAEQDPRRDVLFVPASQSFREMAEIALMRRFVAGQLHWTLSGIPRSWPLRMKWRDALRTVGAVREMGGWAPYFEAHIPSSGSPFLIESEYKRCYARMAHSMELQPGIRGIVGSSWLHSEETMRISPHLAWINRLFLDNGGILVEMGAASQDSGFLAGSQQRRQLYESGAYQPRHAMFIWPRVEFLRWGRQYRISS